MYRQAPSCRQCLLLPAVLVLVVLQHAGPSRTPVPPTTPNRPLQSERNALHSSLTETKRLLASAKDQHDRHLLESEADVKTREALLLEAKAKELADLRELHARCGSRRSCYGWAAGSRGRGGGKFVQARSAVQHMCAFELPSGKQRLARTCSCLPWRRDCPSHPTPPIPPSGRERAGAEAKHREQLEALQARAAELEVDNRALREQKYVLDTRVSELSHKLGAAEGSNRWARRGAGGAVVQCGDRGGAGVSRMQPSLPCAAGCKT